ncbi:PTS sugar transporter subunit IIA [Methylobacterium oryzae]|uniref:PTS sugar transporter subunit IIA n=1 Tax=Methylobacterium oryzae TaxID=334852 RepID=UPI002F30AD64
MSVDRILAPSDALVGLRAAGKGALLEELARRAAGALGLTPEAILPALIRRESLGVGDGIALPHARLEGIARPYGILARLRDPIDFDAVDARPVDLVVLLLLPAVAEGETLNALACVARRLRDPGAAAAMRAARDAAALYAAATGR